MSWSWWVSLYGMGVISGVACLSIDLLFLLFFITLCWHRDASRRLQPCAWKPDIHLSLYATIDWTVSADIKCNQCRQMTCIGHDLLQRGTLSASRAVLGSLCFNKRHGHVYDRPSVMPTDMQQARTSTKSSLPMELPSDGYRARLPMLGGNRASKKPPPTTLAAHARGSYILAWAFPAAVINTTAMDHPMNLTHGHCALSPPWQPKEPSGKRSSAERFQT